MILTSLFHEKAAGKNTLSKLFMDRVEVFEQFRKKWHLMPELERDLASGKIDHVQASEMISQCVHENQKRNSGAPALDHIYAALRGVELYPNIFKGIPFTPEEIQVIHLHDVFEDSLGVWGVKDLQRLKFKDEDIAGVDGATKKPGIKYYDSIERGSKLLTLRPKLSEGLYNDSDNPSEKAHRKYSVSIPYMIAVLHGEIEAGSSSLDFAIPRGLFQRDLFEKYSARALPIEHGELKFSSIPAGIGAPAII